MVHKEAVGFKSGIAAMNAKLIHNRTLHLLTRLDAIVFQLAKDIGADSYLLSCFRVNNRPLAIANDELDEIADI